MLAYSTSLLIIAAVSFVVSFSKEDVFTTASHWKIANMMNDFRAYPNKLMWRQVCDLNDKNHPLIFFHQRKAGGTSIRDSLYQVSNRNNLSNYIVCYSKRVHDCDVYELPVTKLYTIYGGHFHWNSLSYLNRFRPRNGLAFNFSCITNFREPISRLKSCLYFRFLDDIKRISSENNTCLADVPHDDLETLINKLDTYGNSCLDEPFRLLSGYYDPDLVAFGTHFTESDLIKALKLTVEHLKLCTPIVREIPESYHLANAKFPQIDGAIQKEHLINTTAANDVALCSARKFSPESERLFAHYTVLERLLYDAVYEKVYQATLDFRNTTLPACLPVR